MLHDHINHEQEKQDRDIQAIHNAITNNRNAAAKAVEDDDWVKFEELQLAYGKLEKQLW